MNAIDNFQNMLVYYLASNQRYVDNVSVYKSSYSRLKMTDTLAFNYRDLFSDQTAEKI